MVKKSRYRGGSRRGPRGPELPFQWCDFFMSDSYTSGSLFVSSLEKKCQKYYFCHQIGSFKLKMHQNQFSTGAPPDTVGELMIFL